MVAMVLVVTGLALVRAQHVSTREAAQTDGARELLRDAALVAKMTLQSVAD